VLRGIDCGIIDFISRRISPFCIYLFTYVPRLCWIENCIDEIFLAFGLGLSILSRWLCAGFSAPEERKRTANYLIWVVHLLVAICLCCLYQQGMIEALIIDDFDASDFEHLSLLQQSAQQDGLQVAAAIQDAVDANRIRCALSAVADNSAVTEQLDCIDFFRVQDKFRIH